jgi:C-terminal processing protease CtpA/Prc
MASVEVKFLVLPGCGKSLQLDAFAKPASDTGLRIKTCKVDEQSSSMLAVRQSMADDYMNEGTSPMIAADARSLFQPGPGIARNSRSMRDGALLIALIATVACGAQASKTVGTETATVSPQVVSLRAFGRLYGVLRWFHPSDAAALIDWDRFAVEGTRRVIGAADVEELRSTLTELVKTFAPTVRFALADETLGPPPAIDRARAARLDFVAWEHQGYGDSTLVSEYASKRRHRPRTVVVPGIPQAALWQAVDATQLRGSRLRLRGKLRVADHGRGRLWVRVERGDKAGFYDTMSDRPVVSSGWSSAEIVGTVDPDATRVAFGVLMTGGGSVWYDDFELAVQGTDGGWESITIVDPGFEAADVFASWGAGTGRTSDASLEGWNVALDRSHAAEGGSSLRIRPATKEIADELFADAPAPGESVDVDLGRGLRARVPISIHSASGRTVGDDPAQVVRLQTRNPPAEVAGFDRIAAIADVLVVWNALQHFWPYWDQVSVDWDGQLDRALADALDDRSTSDHLLTLRRLSAVAADGHASNSCPGSSLRGRPPFLVDVVEGQLVITATADDAVAPGDVVISVDGRPASEQLAEDQALASGSPQWRLVRACQRFGTGSPGSQLSLRIRRGGAERDVTVLRGSNNSLREFAHKAIEHLADDIYYVDLDRAEMSEIVEIIGRLAVARGIVFDLRGYPNSNHRILSYLLSEPAEISVGMAIPNVTRPRQAGAAVSSWKTSPERLPVLEPHIRGRVAFLTGPAAISYAETVLAIVERYRLGAIVGSATAGTNGNIAEIAMPTGCRTRFTGLRVTKTDGSRFHLVGIQPTVPASRTLAGVAAGRDEVLEKGLSYVRGARKP